jgi:hypothetical protein
MKRSTGGACARLGVPHSLAAAFTGHAPQYGGGLQSRDDTVKHAQSRPPVAT